ncbi:MAG TPA: response regulator [Spirochaetota bacterium]|nr:response regulator [Spirochaetota bacterium]
MRNRKNILIVDDSKIEQAILKSALQKSGFNVFKAEKVSDASAIIGMQNAGIVLVDFYRAGFGKGSDLVSKIRKYNVDVLVYAISSSPDTNKKLLD